MRVKYINRRSKNRPQLLAMDFAQENGFKLQREPYGQRGSLIEVYNNNDIRLGFRKSYTGILKLMKKNKANDY